MRSRAYYASLEEFFNSQISCEAAGVTEEPCHRLDDTFLNLSGFLI